MSQVVQKVLTTTNKKGFKYTDPRIAEVYPDMKLDEADINVLVEVSVPDNAQEAAGESFYGSEETVNKAIQNDWSRVAMNAGRPILRESDKELNWVQEAQNAADQYRPGRRGGFKPQVTEEELDQFDDLDALKAFLKSKKGLVATAEA